MLHALRGGCQWTDKVDTLEDRIKRLAEREPDIVMTEAVIEHRIQSYRVQQTMYRRLIRRSE